MKTTNALITAAIGGLLMGCGPTENPHEKQGQTYLEKARSAMRQKNFDRAKAQIEELRDSVPLAIQARKAGILLMDSIELAMAQEDLNRINRQLADSSLQGGCDSLQMAFDEACRKIKFYSRKIRHDKSSLKTTSQQRRVSE